LGIAASKGCATANLEKNKEKRENPADAIEETKSPVVKSQ